MRGGGECQDFPSKDFCTTMPKIFAREPYCVVFQENSGSEKDYGLQREYHDFPSKNFCLRVPNFFVVENFCAVFQKTSGSGKPYVLERVGNKMLHRKVFVSQCRKLSTFARGTICVVFQ